MLSGRWVRGRRKVMKKPVMAIDMRRTATVLDFAVVIVSKPSHDLWLCRAYLSSPSCDLEWTMRSTGVYCLLVWRVSVWLRGSGAENFRFGMHGQCRLLRPYEACVGIYITHVFLKSTMCSLNYCPIRAELFKRRTILGGGAHASFR
jgi:hypothetical protein